MAADLRAVSGPVHSCGQARGPGPSISVYFPPHRRLHAAHRPSFLRRQPDREKAPLLSPPPPAPPALRAVIVADEQAAVACSSGSIPGSSSAPALVQIRLGSCFGLSFLQILRDFSGESEEEFPKEGFVVFPSFGFDGDSAQSPPQRRAAPPAPGPAGEAADSRRRPRRRRRLAQEDLRHRRPRRPPGAPAGDEEGETRLRAPQVRSLRGQDPRPRRRRRRPRRPRGGAAGLRAGPLRLLHRPFSADHLAQQLRRLGRRVRRHGPPRLPRHHLARRRRPRRRRHQEAPQPPLRPRQPEAAQDEDDAEMRLPWRHLPPGQGREGDPRRVLLLRPLQRRRRRGGAPGSRRHRLLPLPGSVRQAVQSRLPGGLRHPRRGGGAPIRARQDAVHGLEGFSSRREEGAEGEEREGAHLPLRHALLLGQDLPRRDLPGGPPWSANGGHPGEDGGQAAASGHQGEEHRGRRKVRHPHGRAAPRAPTESSGHRRHRRHGPSLHRVHGGEDSGGGAGGGGLHRQLPRRRRRRRGARRRRPLCGGVEGALAHRAAAAERVLLLRHGYPAQARSARNQAILRRLLRPGTSLLARVPVFQAVPPRARLLRPLPLLSCFQRLQAGDHGQRYAPLGQHGK